MYSRLYTRVLNRYSWAQNCTAFHSIFNDTGIVGISAMANAAHTGDMVKVMASELQAVAASGAVTPQELERAKNATVSSILMNLESKAVVAEDIGRQILTYGYRKSAADFIAEVRAVTGGGRLQRRRRISSSPRRRWPCRASCMPRLATRRLRVCSDSGFLLNDTYAFEHR